MTRDGQAIDAQHENEHEPERGERLARFLAHAGVASRRHAETLIAEGRVQVNGITIREQGTRIQPEHDHISVDGKAITQQTRHVYIMLHKPKGYVTTVSDDKQRTTVLDLLPAELRHLRVYPVGRLDIDTSGVLLLTNDGDFALHMTHPRYETAKTYEVLIQGQPSAATLQALRHGVVISEDNGRQYKTAGAEVSILEHSTATTRLRIIIHEGHKRQIRRMFDAVGYPVVQLMRIAIGPLTLQGLAAGSWRYLREDELHALKQAHRETHTP